MSSYLQVLEDYVSNVVMSVITTFFNSRFSEQSTTVQARQPVFVELLQGAYRLSHCDWLSGAQKYHVETCIRTLSEIGQHLVFSGKTEHYAVIVIVISCN